MIKNEVVAKISRMSFEDAFETAYSYVTQVSLDADEVLAKFIKLKTQS